MQTNPQFTYYSYVTWDDLVRCFGNDLVLTIRNYDLYKSSYIQVNKLNHQIDTALPKTQTNYTLQDPQFEANLQIQSDSQPIEVKLVLNHPKQPLVDPLSIADANNDESESDDGSIESTNTKQSRKRKLTRNRKGNDQVLRDESPDTEERNALAKILFNSFDKRFKRDLDRPQNDLNESK